MTAIRQWLPWMLAILFGAANPLLAQDGANVLVVVNTASVASSSIAARYASARAIPAEQIVRLKTGTGDEIERSQYEREIERPIADWITSHGAQDRILYIVLAKGIPLRIGGTSGRRGTLASVDSELTLLYRRLVGGRTVAVGAIGNPYFLGSRPVKDMKPFSHADHDIYLVSRLDGFTEADAIGLIERGRGPARTGTFLLDALGKDGERPADGWLKTSAGAIRAAGYTGRVDLDTAETAARNRKNILGYASWGSNDPALRSRRLGLGFAPGALATLLVSSDARTVKAPPAEWQPTNATGRERAFEGSAQSLAADLISEGVTGVGGYTAEPFLDGTIRPDILFPAYVAGANLVEAFYLATPSLSWQTVVFGDPLCAPFRARVLLPDERQPTLDAETGLPQHFSRRRVAYFTSAGLAADAVKAMLKGEGLRRAGDLVGARQALEAATAEEPRLTGAHRALAGIYEEQGEHAAAIERYRIVLDAMPDDLLSLNNLAYALAVHQKTAHDALPLAQKAYAASKGSVAHITDTLGWIHYLLGQHAEAEKYLAEAAAAAPASADVQLHLAHVHLARGRRDLASRALARSLQLDGKLADRPDVQELRSRLGTR